MHLTSLALLYKFSAVSCMEGPRDSGPDLRAKTSDCLKRTLLELSPMQLSIHSGATRAP